MQQSTPLWQDGVTHTLRPSISQDITVDVVIVGGGYTGLWAAYYLNQIAPNMSIAVLEARHIGFGGSGRNGGWCSAFLPMSPQEMAAQHGVEAMRSIQHEMFTTLDEIQTVTNKENIDCGFIKGGTITSASNTAHIERIRAYIEEWHSAGFDESIMRWQTADQIQQRIAVRKTYGGMFSPHCAAVNPWKLVNGIARVVEQRGVQIFEQSQVLSIDEHVVKTQSATVHATWVVSAIESFASQMKKTKRNIAPLYSLMVATEPLPKSVWDEIGWNERETFADGRNMVTYAQRTTDNRIAFGGRGAPYHFGSQISPNFDAHAGIHKKLQDTVRETFPLLKDVKFTHQWGGPVGAPRDWHAFANVDRSSGLCAGGGYVGDGVALSNLVGRTLAHLIMDTSSHLTRSLLVNHNAKKWEYEPLRWCGINGLLKLTDFADARERRTGKPAARSIALRDGLLG